MVFWIGVLVGGLFVFIGLKMGFFATWIMLWNLALACYMAVAVTPIVTASVPAATSSPHGFALVFVSVFVATLLISYGICYGCLSGQLRVDFPKMFDIASGIMGFLAGFLVWSFASFALCLTPLSQEESLKNLGIEPSSQETNQSYLGWWCDRIHAFVGASGSEMASEESLSLLLTEAGVTPGEPDADVGPPIIRKPAAAPATTQGSTSRTPSAQDDSKATPRSSPPTQSGKANNDRTAADAPVKKPQADRAKQTEQEEPEEPDEKEGKTSKTRPKEEKADKIETKKERPARAKDDPFGVDEEK